MSKFHVTAHIRFDVIHHRLEEDIEAEDFSDALEILFKRVPEPPQNISDTVVIDVSVTRVP